MMLPLLPILVATSGVAYAPLPGDEVPPTVPSAAPARAFVVLDQHLAAVTGKLESLQDGKAVVVPPGGERTTVTAAAVISASHWGPTRKWNGEIIGEALAGEPGTQIELADGTTLIGTLAAAKPGAPADSYELITHSLGAIDFRLDALRRLIPTSSGFRTSDKPTPKKDTLLLANDDVLEGFVSAITPAADGATVAFEAAGQKTTVPFANIRELRLANPPSKTPSAAAWLHGGAVLTFARLSVRDGEAHIARTAETLPARIRLDDVAALLIDPQHVTPLAATPAESSGAPLQIGPADPLATRDITLMEPGAAAFPIPDGATRIAGWLILPDDCRVWGDEEVTLSLESGGKSTVLAKEALNPARPEVAFAADLPAPKSAKLRVTLTEGKYGPIQDRVTLRRVLIAR